MREMREEKKKKKKEKGKKKKVCIYDLLETAFLDPPTAVAHLGCIALILREDLFLFYLFYFIYLFGFLSLFL
jgi:hypothetical protein